MKKTIKDAKKVADANEKAVARKTPDAKISDKQRFDWLERHEAHLVSHREKNASGGYWIFWNVVKRRKSISGHPLGSPRAAIDAAIEASVKKSSTCRQGKTCGNCTSFRPRKGCVSDVVSGVVAIDTACAYWQAKA